MEQKSLQILSEHMTTGRILHPSEILPASRNSSWPKKRSSDGSQLLKIGEKPPSAWPAQKLRDMRLLRPLPWGKHGSPHGKPGCGLACFDGQHAPVLLKAASSSFHSPYSPSSWLLYTWQVTRPPTLWQAEHIMANVTKCFLHPFLHSPWMNSGQISLTGGESISFALIHDTRRQSPRTVSTQEDLRKTGIRGMYVIQLSGFICILFLPFQLFFISSTSVQ